MVDVADGAHWALPECERRVGCQPTRNAASAGWAVTGSLGSPGSSVLAAARRSRGEELVLEG